MLHEILTPDEFAQRLKIGRTTLFEWIRNGVLVPGKHYVRIGRILRFLWSDDVLISLEMPKAKEKAEKYVHQKRSKINWGY